MAFTSSMKGLTMEDAIPLFDDDEITTYNMDHKGETEEDEHKLSIPQDDHSEPSDDDDVIILQHPPDETQAIQAHLAPRAALPSGHRYKSSARTPTGLYVTPGTSWRRADGDFFRVVNIIQAASAETHLEGYRLKRHRDVYLKVSKHTGQPLHAILPLQKNDLCIVSQEVASHVSRPRNHRSLDTMPLCDVIEARSITFTNHDFPAFGYLGEGLSAREIGSDAVEKLGVLCCRWNFVEEFDTTGRKVVSYKLTPLRQEECDAGKGMSDVLKRGGYGRQRTAEDQVKTSKNTATPQATGPRPKPRLTLNSQLVDLTLDEPTASSSKKRTYTEVEEEQEVEIAKHKFFYKKRAVNIVEESFRPTQQRSRSSPTPSSATQPRNTAATTVRKRKYAVGDACAGGGLVSRAAEMEGLELVWTVDFWNVAIETLHKNWPDVRHFRMAIQDFVVRIELDQSGCVDVIHISFPCQGHSWLNRGTNPEKDAINNATVMALEELLKKHKPRIVTMEQTNGILTKNEGFYFRKVVQICTKAGYGLQWKVFDMLKYGVPAARKRLIIIAACPGERLPEWPLPTHGDGPGQKDHVTVNRAFRNIPPHATLNDIAEAKRRFRIKGRKLPVANGNLPLPELVACAGAQFLHPDGDYWPTMRQQMRLQTFPDHHDLAGSTQLDYTTQIGNAVPCVFMRKIFREVLKTLEESDRESEAWESELLTID